MHGFYVRRITAGVLAAIMMVCTGCDVSFPSQSDSSDDGSGYTFTIDLTSNPESLDPQSATDAASITVIRNLYEGLVEKDENGEIQLAAAASYTVSDDGLTYTFQLNNDRYWYYDEDGDDDIDEGETWQVTADDYVFAFQRIFNSETQSPYVEMFSCLKNAEAIADGTMEYTSIGVTAISELQVQFTLEYPNVRFLSLLTTTAAMPCNEEFFEDTKGRYGLDEESVASCGAFYLRLWFYDEYGNDNLIYMRRNSANTSARSVYPSNITFQIQDSLDDAEEDYANEETDLLITSIYPSEYMDDENYTVTSSRATTLGLIFNTESDVYSNLNIRKALSMGIDRSLLGENSSGDLTAAYGIIPPAVSWNGVSYRETIPETETTYDADAAVAVLQTGLDELNISSLDSTKILVCAEIMDCENLHDIIQTWQEIFGFYIGIEEVTETEYWERIESQDYTIAVYSITGEQNDPASVLEEFASDANDFSYENETVDAQLSTLQTCETDTELLQQCSTIEQMILDDYWFIPIFYKNQYCVSTSDNADLGYDPFTESLFLRDAKHY